MQFHSDPICPERQTTTHFLVVLMAKINVQQKIDAWPLFLSGTLFR